MNLIEAVKSGKPFRRPGLYPFDYQGELRKECIYGLREVDILADDWELVEPKVTITRDQLLKAINTVARRQYTCVEDMLFSVSEKIYLNHSDDIAKELGL